MFTSREKETYPGMDPERPERWQTLRRAGSGMASAGRGMRDTYGWAREAVAAVDHDNPATTLVAVLIWGLMTSLLWWWIQESSMPKLTLVAVGTIGPFLALWAALFVSRGSSDAAQEGEKAQYRAILAKYQDGQGVPRNKLGKRANKWIPDDEIVLYHARAHPLSIVFTVNPVEIFGVLVDLITFAYVMVYGISWTGFAFFVAGTAPMLLKIWNWAEYETFITSRRILRIQGIIHDKIETLDEQRILTSEFNISGYSKTLSTLRFIKRPFGSMELESAAQKEFLGWMTFMSKPILMGLLLGARRERKAAA